jgi:hypothetical protein
MAIGKNRAIGLGMLVAAVVSAAPTVWWLSVVTTMRGPHTEARLSDTVDYIALNAPFLIIPAVAIVTALYLISSPEGEPRRKARGFAVWLWVLLVLNPIAYILWLMHSLEGM